MLSDERIAEIWHWHEYLPDSKGVPYSFARKIETAVLPTAVFYQGTCDCGKQVKLYPIGPARLTLSAVPPSTAALRAEIERLKYALQQHEPVHLSGEFPWSREDAEAAMTIAVAAVNQQHEKATAAMRAEIERLKYALQQHDQVADEKTDAAHRSFVRAEKAEAQIEKLRGLLQRARNQYSKPWPPEFDKAVDAALSNNPEQS